jgi:hypothetical protein
MLVAPPFGIGIQRHVYLRLADFCGSGLPTFNKSPKFLFLNPHQSPDSHWLNLPASNASPHRPRADAENFCGGFDIV